MDKMDKIFRRGGGGALYVGPEVAAIVLLSGFTSYISEYVSVKRSWASIPYLGFKKS